MVFEVSGWSGVGKKNVKTVSLSSKWILIVTSVNKGNQINAMSCPRAFTMLSP